MIIYHNFDCRWHKQGRTSTKLHGMYSDKDLFMVIFIDAMMDAVNNGWNYAKQSIC
jgi:hypothetical protein